MSQICEFCKKTGTHTERCPNAGFHVCDPIEDIGPDFQFITQPVIPPNTYMEFWVDKDAPITSAITMEQKKFSFFIAIHKDNMEMTHLTSRAIELSSKDTTNTLTIENKN